MLLHAGMRIVRLNFSHGTHEEHERQATWVREEAARMNIVVPIVQDLQGPKLRVGKMDPHTVLLSQTEFVLTTQECVGDASRASVSHETLAQEVRPGQRILLDDGQIQLQVLHTTSTDIVTRVVVGGPLSDHKGINVPESALTVPAFSAKDEKDLRWGLAFGVDAVALSFVRTSSDVSQVRAFVQQQAQGDVHRYPPLLIAKIEKPQALENLDAILVEADGIMVARGDLGVECGPEKVPLLQKTLIEKANRQGKLVITATQMLESMIHHARPTRAEASDVANAVLDGTDAVMLSAETAQGEHPALVVETMVNLVREVERSERFAVRQRSQPSPRGTQTSHAVAHAAAVAAEHLSADAITIAEETGVVSKLLSEYRPAVPLWVHVPHIRLAQQLAAYWGLWPVQDKDHQAQPKGLKTICIQEQAEKFLLEIAK